MSSIKSCYAANDVLQDGAACHTWPGDTAPRLKCSSFVWRSARADVSPPTRLVKDDFGTITFPSIFKFYAHQEKKKIKRPNSQVRIALQYCIDNETLFTSCFTPIEQNIFCYFVYLLLFFGLCTVIMQQTSHLLILDGVCERNRGEKMTSLQNKHPL